MTRNFLHIGMQAIIFSYLIVSLISCKVVGTYKFLSKQSPNLKYIVNTTVEDPKIKYGRFDVVELRLKPFGIMNYRFTKTTSEGSVTFIQDRPLNKGNWEINNDTLYIFYTAYKSDVPNKFLLSGDTLIPVNNKEVWQKIK